MKTPKKVIALNEFLWRTLENHPKLKPIQHPEFKMMDRKIETQISGSQTVLQILKHPRNLLVQSVSWKIWGLSPQSTIFLMILLVGNLWLFNFGSLEHSKMLDFFGRKVKRGTYNTPLEASVACVFWGGNLDVLGTGGGTFDIWQHVFCLVGGKLYTKWEKNTVKIAICSGFFDWDDVLGVTRHSLDLSWLKVEVWSTDMLQQLCLIFDLRWLVTKNWQSKPESLSFV